MFVRRLITIGLAIALPLAMDLVTAPAAQAAPADCVAPANYNPSYPSNYPPAISPNCAAGLDGKDPVDTGCAADGRWILTKSTPYGRIDIMWSGNCGTNWARFTPTGGGHFESIVWRKNFHDGWLWNEYKNVPAGQLQWSDMYVAPHEAKACFKPYNPNVGFADDWPDSYCTGWTLF